MKDLTIPSVPEAKAMDLFTTDNGLQPYLDEVAKLVKPLVFDMSIGKDREALRSVAAKITKSKTAIEAAGKAQADIAKAKPKLIDAERRRIKAEFEALHDEVRKPLTDFEDAEKKRVEDIKEKIDRLETNPFQYDDSYTSADVLEYLEKVKNVDTDDSFDEFQADAVIAKQKCIENFTSIYQSKLKHEKEQEELAKLKAEAEAREQKERETAIAKQAEERAKLEAEEAAEQERLKLEQKANAERAESERRELELKLAAQTAEREKIEAQQRADQAEERAKQDLIDEQHREKLEADKREANTKHNAKINNAALKAIQKSGITTDQAKEVVKLIASGKVPNVTIQY